MKRKKNHKSTTFSQGENKRKITRLQLEPKLCDDQLNDTDMCVLCLWKNDSDLTLRRGKLPGVAEREGRTSLIGKSVRQRRRRNAIGKR